MSEVSLTERCMRPIECAVTSDDDNTSRRPLAVVRCGGRYRSSAPLPARILSRNLMIRETFVAEVLAEFNAKI